MTGELKFKVDSVWNAFWSGRIVNPLEVMEQITFLLFIKRLDDLHTAEEKKARLLKNARPKIFDAVDIIRFIDEAEKPPLLRGRQYLQINFFSFLQICERLFKKSLFGL